MKKMIRWIWIMLLSLSTNAYAQSCESTVVFQLVNNQGGTFSRETVKLTSLGDGSTYKATSDESGQVQFTLPCDHVFDVKISNYTHALEITSPARSGGQVRRTLTYAPDMAANDKLFAMSEVERRQLDELMKTLPVMNRFEGSTMRRPYDIGNYCQLVIQLKDLENGPLANEEVTMTGETRGKSFQGITGSSGQLIFYLPKGDTYSLNFRYQKNYAKEEIRYTKGTASGSLSLSYMGTKEYLRRKKIEEERIRKEEERIKAEHDKFVAWCKAKGVTEEEGYRLKMEEASEGWNNEPIISTVLNRNKWSEKLIVCDLTGSMLPYAAQLSAWYQLNIKVEPNLQFVFFNDGDAKSTSEKVIGATGGIYYQRAQGLEKLVALMGKVQSNGDGGDCPENNMEALIEGVKRAGPYKELVMIVDNNAPVKDIELVHKFNRPVHIILCGATSGRVMEDYLLIAWKTKGSIHTMEEDIQKIAKMAEGQTIDIKGVTYKIMGGVFVQVTGI